MSDIDFDELDKAVSALMTDDGSAASANHTPAPIINPTTPKESPSAESTQESIPQDAEDTETQQSTAVAQSPVQPLSIKRRGRFMDVIHPKSDMTSQLPVKHHTTVVRPPVNETNSSKDSYEDSPSAGQEEAPLYPDPIDLQEDTSSLVNDAPHKQDEQLHDAPAQEIDADRHEEQGAVVEEDSEAPQTSPFLTDAKVEKRPLGAPTQPEADSPESTSYDTNFSVDDPEAQTAPTPVTSLPPELQPEVAKLDAEVVTPAEPLREEKTTAKSEAVVPAGGSIAQQYTEKPSSVDQTSGSIYDTDSYHQPLLHPEKKKSSAVVIVWILVLALLGAIGAAGFFYMSMR